ncbi:MAG: type II toxin-antitoxin system RelE/ParE family toxin [Salinisphaera sp.]|jgi:hypothetical protein|nr:type II toxin-antitoxin system RelE/ParE family toxin [Salinisphaera sp.]
MQTVAETSEFVRRIGKLIGETEHRSLIEYLASRPKAGVLLKATGGIRKLRWAREGSGKSGGVRVIYYFHDERLPLYLLTVFGKNEQSNITDAQRKELASLAKLLARNAGI